VQFVERAPSYVSPLAQGYIQKGDVPIVLITSTSAFDRARHARSACADVEAIREIVGVLAHEEWHVLHGNDEASAYDAQLTALLFAGAEQDSPLYHKIMRAKQAVIAASKRTSGDGVLASVVPGPARAHPP
jgi:hypothetical protein